MIDASVQRQAGHDATITAARHARHDARIVLAYAPHTSPRRPHATSRRRPATGDQVLDRRHASLTDAITDWAGQ